MLADFYAKVFGRPSDSTEGEGWYGWLVGGVYFSIGEHSEVKGQAKEPQRIILNFETKEINKEFERIKLLGAAVMKELYEMEGMWIATFKDPDENFFQLMTPWEPKTPKEKNV